MIKRFRLLSGSALTVLAVAALSAITGCSSDEETAPTDPETDGKTAVQTPPSPEVTSSESGTSEQAILAEAYANLTAVARLGARLYHDNRLSNPGANLAANCRTCHVPPEASGGARRYTDITPLSVIPANARGSKQETLRNTSTLLDVVTQDSFNADGEFTSLRDLLAHKLTSPHMGWLPGEEDRAKDEIFALLFNDQGEDLLAEGTYLEQFKAAKEIDIESLTSTTAFDAVIDSLIDYLSTIRTQNTSPYDALTYLNRFNEGLSGEGDTPEALSGRIFGRIANQEGRVLIRFPNVYDEEAYQGLKTFFRVIPTWSSSVVGMEENIGNCIVCHVPPKFTDEQFHNIGVTQAAYDAVHGEGEFANVALSAPSAATRAQVDADDATKADLGRWNVDPKDDMVGAFRTPKLRFIERTGPYMHDGSAATIEDAIRRHIEASELAKAGKLRNPDPALVTMNISEQDVRQLAAFLSTLDEVPKNEYRDFRIENVRIRQDPIGEQTYDN